MQYCKLLLTVAYTVLNRDGDSASSKATCNRRAVLWHRRRADVAGGARGWLELGFEFWRRNKRQQCKDADDSEYTSCIVGNC